MKVMSNARWESVHATRQSQVAACIREGATKGSCKYICIHIIYETRRRNTKVERMLHFIVLYMNSHRSEIYIKATVKSA